MQSSFVSLSKTRLGRQPTEKELAESQSFLRQEERHLTQLEKLKWQTQTSLASADMPAAEPGLRARENLVHVLFNHNDFVTIR